MLLARDLERMDLVDELNEMCQRLSTGLSQRWREDYRAFLSLDLISGKDIVKVTQACFIPLLVPTLTREQTSLLSSEITRWCESLVLGLPSTPRFSPDFDSKRYWRGPVWAVINWLISLGLRTHEQFELASKIEMETIDAIERAGFSEYFDPLTGEGLGGENFSWTAAAYLVLIDQ